ncbi:hypothetical protein Gogos_009140 [Gossypium gossypioides]|uniref:Uncharacterized protein n=1 Tax=Gossypium gossypioides TaxID=34282 RepID=A0A7J9CE30_GOSGO|nr:hypothetical protein [Gossypium gossypioides]
MRNDHRTVLDGTLVFDTANKLSARHELGSFNCKLKYSYVHRGLTTFEPCYDLEKKSWDLAVSRRILGGDLIKANYETLSQVLGVEWSCSSLVNEDGRVKVFVFLKGLMLETYSDMDMRVSASFNLAEGFHTPKLSVQSMWNFQA